jgi:mannose-6-phosphate isomerase-like protein (cupin superfamily)
MRDGLIVGDLADPSVVYGVHGTTGLSKWKCLARRCGLFGTWEAVEWAWLPPGGVSGEHVHTRTEEIYFIISGRGEMMINGRPHLVGPGHLILTGLGTRHGLRNIGDDGLGWLVIELLSPATAAVLRGLASAPTLSPRNPIKELAMNAVVVDLRQVREVDPRSVFTGPLQAIKLITLPAGQHAALSAADQEHTLFVLAGAGHIVSGHTSVPLSYGVSVTLPLGSEVVVHADAGGLEYFIASLAVPQSAAS